MMAKGRPEKYGFKLMAIGDSQCIPLNDLQPVGRALDRLWLKGWRFTLSHDGVEPVVIVTRIDPVLL